MTIFWLALAGIVGWFISLLAGGGSALILMPIVGMFLGAVAIAPVITISGLFGNSERVFVYWQKINWDVVKWELPGAIFGGILGAFTLTKLKLDWLSILVGIFLIFSAASYFFKNEEKSFTVKAWYFLPAGFAYAFLSGLIGSMGPVLAPLYINYGLQKEELLATQATNRVIVHIVKIFVYGFLGAFKLPYIGYGIVLGLAAIPGNWLGHLVLQKISEKQFRRLVISFVLFSGMLILWQQRELLVFW
jgi:uncharacterized membrane protein YfcA